jgi:VanZ family protein
MRVAWFQKIKFWLPPSVWGLCILSLSSIPGDDLPKEDIPHLDKVVHLGIYGILGFLVARTRLPFWGALSVSALFGVLDEIYQNWTPQRTPDPMDWLMDVAGACLGILIVHLYTGRLKRGKI